MITFFRIFGLHVVNITLCVMCYVCGLKYNQIPITWSDSFPIGYVLIKISIHKPCTDNCGGLMILIEPVSIEKHIEKDM